MNSGRRLSGDYYVLDVEKYTRSPEKRHCHVETVKEIYLQPWENAEHGVWALWFPVAEGCLRYTEPRDRDTIASEASEVMAPKPVDEAMFPPASGGDCEPATAAVNPGIKDEWTIEAHGKHLVRHSNLRARRRPWRATRTYGQQARAQRTRTSGVFDP